MVKSPLGKPISPLLRRAMLAPDSINPADACHLQRAIGNQAMGRLATGRAKGDSKQITDAQSKSFQAILNNPARALPSAIAARKPGVLSARATGQPGEQGRKEKIPVRQMNGSDRAIQRRIGFEIETGIPVMEEHPANSGGFRGLDNDELEANVPGGKLMVDHLPGHADDGIEEFDEWNILEFVTDPVADRLSDAAFRAQARQWITNLQAIRTYAQGNFAKWGHVPNAGAAANPNIWIGLRPGRAGGFGFWERIAPQATMGIRLDKIADVFSSATAGGHAGHVRHDRVSEGAHRGGPVADTIMTQLKENYPPTWRRKGGIKSLQGLITLICNYILSGAATEGKGGYNKNRSLFMYKSKLSSVRNDVIGEYYGGKILNRGAPRRTDLKNRILAETQRAANDEVFSGARYKVDPDDDKDPGVPVLTGDWIDEVLSGTDDKIFDALKNPWSNEINPENVGGKKAAVMEMRDISAFGIWGFNLQLSDTDDIVDYLASVYGLNKRWSKGKD
jgi:hypothetical protein